MPLTPTSPRIAYTAEGDSGPPVLLIMGFGMSGVVWRPQVDGLKGAHRVAFYDHLGVGGSEPPPSHPTMASMAGDAMRVLDALAWPEAHVVGVSMGGMIAQEVALLAPSRVRSLTLIATHAGGVRAVLPRVEGLARFAEANLGDPKKRIDALKRLLYTPEFLATIDEAQLERRMHDMTGKRAPPTTLRGHLRAVLRHRTRERLASLRVPTLVVKPSRDILVHPHNSDVLARAIPGARLVRFDDAGHGVTFQCAAALNAELGRHIAEAERGRAKGAALPRRKTARAPETRVLRSRRVATVFHAGSGRSAGASAGDLGCAHPRAASARGGRVARRGAVGLAPARGRLSPDAQGKGA